MQQFVESVKMWSSPLPVDKIMFNGKLFPKKYNNLPTLKAEVLAIFITFFLIDENENETCLAQQEI